MIRYKQILLTFFTGIIALCSCAKYNAPDDEYIEPGIKTTINLQLSMENMDVVSRAVMDVDVEKEINSLAVYIFDKDGILLSSAMHDKVVDHLVGGKLEEGGYISIPAITGNNRKVYTIANYNKNHIENLKNVATESDLQNIVVTVLGNPLLREFGMVKVGMLDKVSIRLTQPSPIKVPIEYLSAKITVHIINKSGDLEIDGWGIDGVAMKEYLLKREETSDPNYHDAADIYNPDDYYSDFSDQSMAFDSQPSHTVYGDPTTPPEYKIEFYLLENRRGVKRAEDKTVPPDGWPHGIPDGIADDRTGNNAYKIKSWEAPEHATRFRIVGLHKRDGDKKLTIINHYLGANNVDDYNVCRATHYTYTITINSITDIDIDTNIEQSPNYVFVRNPPDLTNIDAHASFRMFTLHTEHVTDGQVDIEVLNSVNSTSGDFPTWLKLSPLMTNIHQVKSSESQISRWQEDGAMVGTYVRPKFIPHKSKRVGGYVPPSGITIKSDLPDGSPDLTGQNPDLLPFGTEYPNNDDVLPYRWTFRRMCSKITNIPTIENGVIDPIHIFLYADESPYVDNVMGSQYREAVIRISYTKNGKSEHEHYQIRQYAPIRFLGLPTDNDMMVVERMEEYAHMLQTTLPLKQQFISGMQWGDYDVTTSASNGYENTIRQVYKNVSGAPTTYRWDTYLTKYGSHAAGWTTAATDSKGTITEPAIGTMLGSPYYNFSSSPNDYYNTIYNSTAARYCHEKNFDENGDGQLSESETHWYLPSQQELQLFWTYQELLDLNSDYYWSSTSSPTDNKQAYAASMTGSRSDPHRYYNGVQQLMIKSNDPAAMAPRVRCVRRVSGTPLLPMVKHQIDGTTLIDCSNMPGDFYTSISKMGSTQQDVNLLQKLNKQVFKKFQVQKIQDVVTSYSDLHNNGGKCKEHEGWRLPTQREMLLIWSVKKQLETDVKFDKFNASKYWTMTRGITNQYVIDFTTGIATYEDAVRNTNLNYRCIKEVQ